MIQLSTTNYTITINKFIDTLYIDIDKTNSLAINILDNIIINRKEVQ